MEPTMDIVSVYASEDGESHFRRLILTPSARGIPPTQSTAPASMSRYVSSSDADKRPERTELIKWIFPNMTKSTDGSCFSWALCLFLFSVLYMAGLFC